MEKYIDSKAKDDKPGYHLYGDKEVSLFNKKPQKTYVAGVIQQKKYVSFYFSPVYSHPELIEKVNPDLKKFLRGKSCFNIPKLNRDLLPHIEQILDVGITKYKEIGWI